MNATAQHEALALVPDAPAALPATLLPPAALAPTSPASIMLAMMERGASLDQIRQMMDIEAQWKVGEAVNAYNASFAAFKAEAVRIIKSRTVTDGPLKGKSYAELSVVVDAITPALSRHGLGASWKLTKDDRDWIEVTCTLKHVAGHFESVSMGGPPDAGGAKNAIQARASTVSYLERYTLKAITGLAESGQDTDANTAPGPITQKILAGLIEDLQKTKTDEQAFALWLSGSKTLAATESIEAHTDFKQAVLAHRRALKGGAQ